MTEAERPPLTPTVSSAPPAFVRRARPSTRPLCNGAGAETEPGGSNSAGYLASTPALPMPLARRRCRGRLDVSPARTRVGLHGGPRPRRADPGGAARPRADRPSPPPWLEPRKGPDGRPALDVLIVGGGQCGARHRLRAVRAQVTNILVIDKAARPRGALAHLCAHAHAPQPQGLHGSRPRHTQPDLPVLARGRSARKAGRRLDDPQRSVGRLPALGPRRHGHASPQRDHPGRYRPGRRSCSQRPSSAATAKPILHARKIVLATGQDGMGLWWMPQFVAGLPARASRPLRRRDRFRILARTRSWRSSAPAPRPWTMPPWRWSTARARCSCSAGATPSRSCSPTAG